MLPDLFQTQQSQDQEAILLMAANSNTNGLNVLQEIDRDGVELRLINNNLLNSNLNNNNNANRPLDHSLDNQNESGNEDDLTSLLSGDGGESQQTLINSNSNLESNNGQILSVNGLENLASNNNLNLDSQNQQNFLERRRSSININQELNLDTSRVIRINFFLTNYN